MAICLTTSFTACSTSDETPKESSLSPASSESPSGVTAAFEEVSFEEVSINVAYHPGLASLCVPGIGEEQGIFKEEGLTVNWIQFTAGPPEIAAMVAGDLQFGYIGHGAHTLCAQGEANVISLSHISNAEQIIARANSGIDSIEDLTGKKIVVQLGTSGETILNLAMEKAGLTRDDVNVYAMDMPGAVSAFIAGQADAIASWDTHTVNIRANVADELVVLAQTSDFTDTIAFPGSWVATPEYLEENRDVAVRFARALNKIYDYRAGNMDETVRLSAEFASLDYDSIDATRNSAVFYSGADLRQMLSNGEILAIYQSQLDNFIAAEKVENGDVSHYVRTDIMEEALGY